MRHRHLLISTPCRRPRRVRVHPARPQRLRQIPACRCIAGRPRSTAGRITPWAGEDNSCRTLQRARVLMVSSRATRFDPPTQNTIQTSFWAHCACRRCLQRAAGRQHRNWWTGRVRALHILRACQWRGRSPVTQPRLLRHRPLSRPSTPFYAQAPAEQDHPRKAVLEGWNTGCSSLQWEAQPARPHLIPGGPSDRIVRRRGPPLRAGRNALPPSCHAF